jgi:hypothetical protein
MTYEEILQVLEKYDVTSINDLEYYLSAYSETDECIDDPEEKDCTHSNCYEDIFVPDCRKVIEIYKKYFNKDIKNKKKFIEYLVKATDKKESSIENYMSCKSCNQQIKKQRHNSLKISDSDFKKDFCNNLDKKFNYTYIFETDYETISQFLRRDLEVTKDNFIPLQEGQNIMTKEEQDKLFDIVHTTKAKLKDNLNENANLYGSDEYRLNLALYAFERNLISECENILTLLSEEYKTHEKYLQLKAKILSNQKKDQEAIEVLTDLANSIKPEINSETNNLLAASIKREAFTEFEKYKDEEILKNKLEESRDVYFSVYNLNKDYYPALNYIYLQVMLGYINNSDRESLQDIKDEASKIWNHTEHKINDWWSFIANIEYLVLIGNYTKAKEELDLHFSDLDTLDISDFNILSTTRQLKLYSLFCTDTELTELIDYIENINDSIA